MFQATKICLNIKHVRFAGKLKIAIQQIAVLITRKIILSDHL